MQAEQTEFSRKFRSQTQWNWQVALDLFSGGLGGGLFLISVWTGSLTGAWVAVGLVLFAALVLMSHLHRPMHFWRAFRGVSTSWISRGALFVTLFFIFAVLALLPGVGGAVQTSWADTHVAGKALLVLAGITAALVVIYPGFVLTSSPSIPFWHTPLLPVLFVTYSLGGAMLLLFLLGGVPLAATHDLMASVALPLAALNAVLLAFYLEVMRRSTAAARESVRRLTKGHLSGLFYGGVVGLGLVLPLLLLAAATATGMPAAWVQVAAVATLIGGYLFRYSLLRAGIYGSPV